MTKDRRTATRGGEHRNTTYMTKDRRTATRGGEHRNTTYMTKDRRAASRRGEHHNLSDKAYTQNLTNSRRTKQHLQHILRNNYPTDPSTRDRSHTDIYIYTPYIYPRGILVWMTPSEVPKALQASGCSELLDPMRALCWSFA